MGVAATVERIGLQACKNLAPIHGVEQRDIHAEKLNIGGHQVCALVMIHDALAGADWVPRLAPFALIAIQFSSLRESLQGFQPA